LKTGKAAVQIAQKQRKRRLEGRERSLLVGILLFAGKLRTGKSKADRAIKLSSVFTKQHAAMLKPLSTFGFAAYL